MMPKTLGELRASGYRPRTVRQELRANLVMKLKSGDDVFPGIIGFERTVIPQVQNAILSAHDFILLGLRGQAKSRILRALSGLLDASTPAIADSPLNEDPMAPISASARRRIAEEGDDLPIVWLSREDRYHEKLATPDVTVADLIGDIDPLKAVTQKLTLDDPEAINFGVIPRSNRGIFAINELPDLQPRIQVALLNLLEERDIQIRGFPIRLPLDILMVFSANPEDYTNRGNIITPLRDRIASQILTHYPRTVEDSRKITEQEAWTSRDDVVDISVPEYLRVAIEEVAFRARESDVVDQSSGVSARMTISLLENVISNAERRALINAQTAAVARVSDLFASITAITGKIELVYEGEREGPRSVAHSLVGKALKVVFEERVGQALKSSDGDAELTECQPILGWFSGQRTLDLTDDLGDVELYERMCCIPSLELVATQYLDCEQRPEIAAAMEFILEGLHQSALLSREDLLGVSVYRDTFEDMVRSFKKT
jgi:magnesium chelatase subunit I